MPMMDVLSEPAELRVGAMVTVPNTRANAKRPEITPAYGWFFHLFIPSVQFFMAVLRL